MLHSPIMQPPISNNPKPAENIFFTCKEDVGTQTLVETKKSQRIEIIRKRQLNQGMEDHFKKRIIHVIFYSIKVLSFQGVCQICC